jgi:multiple sugar transport system permease protein
VTAGTPDHLGPMGTGAATAPIPQVLARAPRRWPRPKVGHLKQAIFLVILLGVSILSVYPFLWLISASLKPQAQVFDNRLIPETFQWNFTGDPTPQPGDEKLFDLGVPVFKWLINSVWISVLAALAVTLSSAVVAFAFAYFRFPLRNIMFGLVLATMMLPGAVTMIPVYLIWNELGLVNTQFPLWVPNLFGSAFYIFLLRQFFLGIPRELFEAARIDGDNFFTMFGRIALPLAKPALIVAFVFEITAKWYDLLTPLIYLRDTALFTLPLGLKTLLDQFGQGGGGEGRWEIVMAGTVVTVIPMIIIFAIFQRYFIEGIATQGRKG